MSENEINTANSQFVGCQAGTVIIMMPKPRMTTEEAVRHAAWLVAIAQCNEDYKEGDFERVFEAVCNT